MDNDRIGRLLYFRRINRLTKVRSRQRVEPAAVQPIVMWTPALGRFRRSKKMKSYFKRNPYIILYLVILCLLTSCQTNKSILDY